MTSLDADAIYLNHLYYTSMVDVKSKMMGRETMEMCRNVFNTALKYSFHSVASSYEKPNAFNLHATCIA